MRVGVHRQWRMDGVSPPCVSLAINIAVVDDAASALRNPSRGVPRHRSRSLARTWRVSRGTLPRRQRGALLRRELHRMVGLQAAEARLRYVEAALRGSQAEGIARSGTMGRPRPRGTGGSSPQRVLRFGHAMGCPQRQGAQGGAPQGALHCRRAPLHHRQRHVRLPSTQGGCMWADSWHVCAHVG